MSNTIRDAALSYADDGLRVFPVVADGKTPLTEHGHLDASVDPNRIRRWFSPVNGQRNLGIATGSGRVVIDVDVKDGKDGVATLARLVAELGPLPDTLTARTPSGGMHLHFGTSPDAMLRLSAGDLGPGIDVRGDGGYALMPPSSIDGQPYFWEDVGPVASLPDAWGERIRNPEQSGAAASNFHEYDRQPVPIGQQEDVLYRRACSLRRHGVLTQDATVAALWAEVETWEQRTADPWTLADVQKKVDRAWQKIAPVGERIVSHNARTTATENADEPTVELPWPTMSDAAYHGFVGDFARSAAQHTEADPVAILASCLTLAGALIGLGPHATAGNAWHAPALFTVIVGKTAVGGKGTSWQVAREATAQADRDFVRERILGGFGSGEALIEDLGGEDEEDDNRRPVVPDRRLVVHEAEFVRILKVAAREGSILGSILRNGWDGEPLHHRVRRHKVTAVDYHLAALCHVTLDELRSNLPSSDVFNGFANRFLWLLARRGKLHPSGGNVPSDLLMVYGRKLKESVDVARKIGHVKRTPAADERWTALYTAMADDQPSGVLGASIARAAPQCLRLSVLYTLLDGVAVIDVEHVEAAWAFWQYCRASAGHVFGDDKLGRLLAGLRASGPTGLAGREQHDLFDRHITADELTGLRRQLEVAGLVVTTKEETGGRPGLRTRAVS